MKIGDRVELTVTVAGISTYNVKDRYNDTTSTLYRHSLRDADNRLYVYSGVQLRIRTGQRVRLRGTVKRYENDYGMVRLSRIKLIETDVQEGML